MADFVRKLLASVSDELFLALTKTARAAVDESQLESKAQSIRRMMSDQVKCNKLRIDYEEAIAAFIEFSLHGKEGRIWRQGTAVEFKRMLENKSEMDADASPDEPLPTQPPPSSVNLDSKRAGKTWSLIESLCSIILFGNQDGRTDLDFELSGQPTPVTITDESGRRILLQREVVVKHCVVELHLGGAEIHGGLTALKRAVSSFVKRPDAHHLLIDVGGSARAPRLTVQVQEGAIGVARPLLGSTSAEPGAAQPACYLVEVQSGTKVTALVRIYGAELQDQAPTKDALSSRDGDENELPVIAQKKRSGSGSRRSRSHHDAPMEDCKGGGAQSEHT